MTSDLQNKRVIITGGTHGIGRRICLDAARAGARIALCGMEEEAPAILEELQALGCEPFVQLFDLTDLQATRQFARDAIAHLGGLDGLVNNAAGNFFYSVAGSSPETIRRCFYTNVYPAWALCQECHAALKAAGWGMIVNMSSINGQQTSPGCFPYNASKAAIDSLTRAIALEWAADNIQAVAIAPGFILTPEKAKQREAELEELTKRILAKYPVRRAGRSEDVASLVLYLLSGANRFISGTAILIDGAFAVGRYEPDWQARLRQTGDNQTVK